MPSSGDEIEAADLGAAKVVAVTARAERTKGLGY